VLFGADDLHPLRAPPEHAGAGVTLSTSSSGLTERGDQFVTETLGSPRCAATFTEFHYRFLFSKVRVRASAKLA